MINIVGSIQIPGDTSKQNDEDIIVPDIKRPEPLYFEDIYGADEIIADCTLEHEHKKAQPDKEEDHLKATLLERMLKKLFESEDWFHEQENYNLKEKNNNRITTVATTNVDDRFNHVDFVGIVHNKNTWYKPLPVAFDATFCFNYPDLKKKLSMPHYNGKKPETPSEYSSEFGDTELGLVPDRYLYGLKIPGFASVKYFEDVDHPNTTKVKKGRIRMMPRIVIGIHPSNIVALDAENQPRYQNMTEKERKSLQEAARLKAKWCVLLECQTQAQDIRYMLENNIDNETMKYKGAFIRKALDQIKQVERYIDAAIEKANEKAQTDPDEAWAKDYAETKDAMVKGIRRMSELVYKQKGWLDPKGIIIAGQKVGQIYAISEEESAPQKQSV